MTKTAAALPGPGLALGYGAHALDGMGKEKARWAGWGGSCRRFLGQGYFAL